MIKGVANIKSKIFLTVFLVYLFYIAPGYLSANTYRYLDLTKAIVDDHTFAIDKYYKNTCDYGEYKGHNYIGAAPGLSLMAIPIYIISKPFLKIIPNLIYQDLEFSILNLIFSIFLTLIPSAVMATLLYGILLEFDLKEKDRLLIVFGFAFGTITFFYSTVFMAHIMGTFMLFSAFYITFKYKFIAEKKYLSFLAGILLGAAVLIDYILIIGSAFIACYYFFDFRKNKIANYGSFILGGLLIAPIYMFYHYRCFGNPFAMATTYSRMIGAHPISAPDPKIMYQLLFGSYRGLFLYMPITLLSVYGIFAFFRHSEKRFMREMILISIFSLSLFLIISGYRGAWEGGATFGPRYFIYFIPFSMIPIVYAFKTLNRKMIFWIIILSVYINWCGVQYGEAQSPFTYSSLFLFKGLNSNLAQWLHKIVFTYTSHFKSLITYLSPLVGFVILLVIIYFIWEKEIEEQLRLHLVNKHQRQ